MKPLWWVAVVFAPSVASAQTFSGLGFLPGDSSSWAVGLSSDGSTVIGRGAVGTTAPHHWIWSAPAGIRSLGTISTYDGESEPFGVTADGGAVTGSIVRNADGNRVGYRWTAAGGIAPLDGGNNSQSPGISGDGTVVIGSSATQQAYRYADATGRESLGPLLGTPLGAGGHSSTWASSFDGSVIVGFGDARRMPPGTPIPTPFRWTVSTGMQAMLNGGQLLNGAATDVSADGTVIVGHQGGGSTFFRWTELDGYQFITPFASSGEFFAVRVSGDGNTIIGRDTYWTAATGPRHVADVLSAAGCDFPGWTITGANGISFDGRTLCGEGIDPQGRREAWIATVPSPSAIVPILVGVLVQGRRRRAM